MGLILSVGEAWMESARKYPRHRTNLGMLRAQDGGQEHPIKVQSIRRGQGSECQFMVNNMMRSGGSKNFVRSVSVQADENKCNV